MPEQTTPAEVRAFTGIRGIAALYVAVYHFGLYYIFRGGARNMLGHGYIAVDLFFMMSGFVMALTYRDLFAGGQLPRNMMDFLGKRIARIYPLYVIASVAALIAVIWAGLSASADQMTATKFVSNLLMVQSWGISDSYAGPGWSISTEWAAYLIFPLLCSIMLFRQRQVALAWAAVAFLFLVLLAELPADMTHVVRAQGPLDLYDGRNYGAVARCLIEFLLGMLCFRASRHRGLSDRLGCNWVSICALTLIGALLAVRNSDILIIPLIALLLVSVARDKGPVARLLGSPVFRWLGTISYSIYLFHTTVQAVAGPTIQRTVEASGVPDAQAVQVLCLVAVVLATATLSYRLIEKPGRSLLRRVFAARGRVTPEEYPLTRRAPRNAERAEETIMTQRSQRDCAPSALNSFG